MCVWGGGLLFRTSWTSHEWRHQAEILPPIAEGNVFIDVLDIQKWPLPKSLKRRFLTERTQCSRFKSVTRAETSPLKKINTLCRQYIFPFCTSIKGWINIRSGGLQCLFLCSRGQSFCHSFICTWSGWPQTLSGASICWISWCSCCFWEFHRRASICPTTSWADYWAGGASGGRSGPLQCIWSLLTQKQTLE